MPRGAVLAALIGFTLGIAVLLATYAIDIWHQGLSPIGGLPMLHARSVSVWVLDSLPFVLGLACGGVVARSAERDRPVPWAKAPPPVAVETLTKAPPPVPNGLRTPTTLAEPPPVPSGIQQSVVPAPVGVTPAGAGAGADNNRIKALHELVKVLKEQAERTQSESRAKSAYLANMSHELRTPLSSIIGYAELLQEVAEERALDLADDLRKVSGSARELGDLLNNILDVSKIEVGQLAVVLEDVDMAQIIAEVRVAVAPLAAASQAAFSTRVAPGARLVRADHMRLRQVIVNLLSNAFKFTQHGQIQLTVERATPKRDAWIAVRVRDTGRGMTPDEVTSAFDEYAQTARRVAGEAGGVGLGLGIARKLAELMGGRIEVQSQKGVGSTFSVILPPAKVSEDTVAPRSSVALNERLAGTKLLIVDGDPFGISLARYLERAGLELRLVTDTDSARLAANAEPPQLAVVDVGLPGAWVFVEDLIVDGVKVVTSSLRDEDVEHALQLGVTSFMVRPLDRKLVLATLERCIDGTPTHPR